MNILIDIGHPAHVHLYRNLYFELIKKEHKVIVTVKSNIYSAIELLQQYKISYISIGSKSNSILGKILKQVQFDFEIVQIIKKYKIELCIGSSISIAHASLITNAKSILLDDDDDDVQPLFVKFAHPFCDILFSPDTLKNTRKSNKAVFYPSYHELAYLHPKVFQPDAKVLEVMNLNVHDKFFLLRFTSFKAHHDINAGGFTDKMKNKLINKLENYGKVFITSESKLDKKYEKYAINIPSNKIHSLLYYSTLFISDSQTMTTEACLLGTPAIRCNSFVGKLSNFEELEHKYHLTFGFLPKDFEKMFTKIDELLQSENLKEIWQSYKGVLLKEKMNLTSFLIWFVENFPDSKKTITERSNIFNEFIV